MPLKTLGSVYIAPHIPNLRSRWRWVVSFLYKSFYPRGHSPW